ncbi:DedA family protein [Rhizobiales bacterium]|uniref:YqaA family protein n=1 Tax=Hongsoonwoonella zoysiae TaxID=2821844 RepID=UPI00156042F9|nr:YqaA family protein [Hongsoonwoonella zoysiae]NRG19300.1 DedA family protein [Hongsoonwoonella zoysiae]
MDDLGVFAGLFAISFAAATVFPAQSEIALTGLIATTAHSTALLVIVASIGNTLGSVVNWVIGRGVESFRHKRWFPVSEKMLDRASRWYHRWGRWSLLMSWAPFIGDPLTVAAGVLREPLWSFVLLVTIAKTVRYILVALATLSVI